VTNDGAFSIDKSRLERLIDRSLPFRELRSLAILSPGDRLNRVKKGESVEAQRKYHLQLILTFPPANLLTHVLYDSRCANRSNRSLSRDLFIVTTTRLSRIPYFDLSPSLPFLDAFLFREKALFRYFLPFPEREKNARLCIQPERGLILSRSVLQRSESGGKYFHRVCRQLCNDKALWMLQLVHTCVITNK